MTKYKPVDTVYEDIYDFDDINDPFFETSRSGNTYTLDPNGNILPSVSRPKAKCDQARLPPVIVGKSLVARQPPARNDGVPRPHKSITKVGGNDLDYHMRAKTPNVPAWRHFEEHKGNRDDKVTKLPPIYGTATRSPYHQNCQAERQIVDEDALYRSLMEGISDKSMLEKSPQVLEYERRNNIKHDGYRRDTPEMSKHLLNRTRDAAVAGQSDKVKRMLPSLDDLHSVNHLQTQQVYTPAPPTAPKPDTPQLGGYRNRRRILRTATSQLDQDISVHNPSKQYHKPRPPSADVQIDWEAEVKEALRVERELENLNKALARQKNADMPYGMEIMRPTTAAQANSNMPGCVTPCTIPTAAVPYKSAEPVKSWNNDAAKRGLGFKSKVKKEQEKRKISVNLIPEKIRKEMKKYFS